VRPGPASRWVARLDVLLAVAEFSS